MDKNRNMQKMHCLQKLQWRSVTPVEREKRFYNGLYTSPAL
jgi:hypothetical protein